MVAWQSRQVGDGSVSAASRDPAVAEKRIEIARAALATYRNPTDGLRMAAVTGTNGKTTTVSILRALLDDACARSASIGTLGVLLGSAGDVIPGGLGLTTPGPEELQRVLRDLADRGVRSVAMEVSSHALDQHRVYGIGFDAAVFTNFTRDHLDYHGSMQEYFAAKARLIQYLRPSGTAVINADQPEWRELPAARRTLKFGERNGDVRAADIAFHAAGSEWTLSYHGESARILLPLLGDFNVLNALAAGAAALALGQPFERVAERLCDAPQVPGRLEVIARLPTVIRDYAHTPDALSNSIAALRPFVRGRLIVVFGAGGDRDPGKRPLMGAAVEAAADHAIVTSDNPRTESPDEIIDEIETGMALPHDRITDRRAAIVHALAIAQPDDLVLLAGKGHETYQVVGTDRHPFDERAIVAELLEHTA